MNLSEFEVFSNTANEKSHSCDSGNILSQQKESKMSQKIEWCKIKKKNAIKYGLFAKNENIMKNRKSVK